MTVKALYDYDFPSRDRQELYGDDILVNVMWANNRMFASPALRAPTAMSWADFKSRWSTVGGSDPDYDPSAPRDWQCNGEAFSPADDVTLADTGVGHKGLFAFRT